MRTSEVTEHAATSERSVDRFVRAYESWERRLADASPPWLLPLRKAALARFAESGLPTTRDEDWRYTNVSFLSRREWNIPERQPIPHDFDVSPRRSAGTDAALLVFVDGWWIPELSTHSQAAGVEVIGLAEALRSRSALLEPYLARLAETKDEPFTALNTASLADGAVIVLERNRDASQPIELLFVASGESAATMTHPRVLLVAGAGSRATIVEHHIALRPQAYFTNAVTETYVGENAQIDHYYIDEHSPEASAIATHRTDVARGGRYSVHTVLLGGSLVRSNVHVQLAGEGCDVLVNGLYLGDYRRHLDNYMRVVHAQPHGTSRQFYHGILDDYSRGVFTGRIIVRPGAQKTDAKQSSRSLLLSPNAEADSRPQLEIYADDVKCTHGATTGQLDPDALFYLRARAMPEQTARSLLTYAFAAEVLDRMPCDPVRRYVETRLLERLPHGQTTLVGAHASPNDLMREHKQP